MSEIENALSTVSGGGPGRRWRTQQLNHAYAIILTAQFQGFTRDLHSESAHILTSAHLTPSGSLLAVLQNNMVYGRQIDQKNPTPGNIGADFARFGLNFWDEVYGVNKVNHKRRAGLDLLCEWRNAIAHQSFKASKLGGSTVLHLKRVRAWKTHCDGLAVDFDRVMAQHLKSLVGRDPW